MVRDKQRRSGTLVAERVECRAHPVVATVGRFPLQRRRHYLSEGVESDEGASITVQAEPCLHGVENKAGLDTGDVVEKLRDRSSFEQTI